jgi:hypothetical protein
MKPKRFNFRHVIMKVGVPSTNENNWAVGQALRQIAADAGIEPARILTEKTDPDPTVSAPHCIAHYPISMFDEACRRVDEMYRDKSRQLTMF